MTDDLLLHERLDALLRDESGTAGTLEEDVARGRRRLRRHRVGTAAAGVTVAAAVAAVAVPAVLPDHARPIEAQVASAPEPERLLPPEAYDFPAAATREVLFATAVEHFDPDRRHLGGGAGAVLGGSGGSVMAGTKLDWTNPGEPGLGMVEVSISTAGAVDETNIIDGGPCFAPECVKQMIPGTDQAAFVLGPVMDRQFAVYAVRPDGTVASVAVHDLFGNNSDIPVSEVGITLEQAFAFVTDPDLHVVPTDVAEIRAYGGDWHPTEEATSATPLEGEPAATP